jgi:hypothetical protein
VFAGKEEIMRKAISFLRTAALTIAAFAAIPAVTVAQGNADSNQEKGSSMPDMPGMQGMNMQGDDMDRAHMFFMQETSGTSFQPAAWQMPMLMTHAGDWHLMWMAQAFVVDTQQSGPRGGDKLYSTNWGMLGAIHKLGSGSIMLRAMVSLEPATITDRRYPLLFQTGETAFGVPLVDAQHPHDVFMEIGVQYAHTWGEHAVWDLYYAPMGEPALGPTAYPHRASAMELPQAALGHHWEDSTHIANNVVTAGITYRKVRLEASGFYGREPNENRWNIDHGAMDSGSVRFSFQPNKNWIAQVSVGRLSHPEAQEIGDVVRTTSSLEYIKPLHSGNSLAVSGIWGQNYKLAEHDRTNSLTAELVLPLSKRDFITGRYEWSQRDELFNNNPALAQAVAEATGEETFAIHAFTLGYTRDIPVLCNVQTGLGANVSTYAFDSALQPYYGSHPFGVNMYLRVRLKPAQ